MEETAKETETKEEAPDAWRKERDEKRKALVAQHTAETKVHNKLLVEYLHTAVDLIYFSGHEVRDIASATRDKAHRLIDNIEASRRRAEKLTEEIEAIDNELDRAASGLLGASSFLGNALGNALGGFLARAVVPPAGGSGGGESSGGSAGG